MQTKSFSEIVIVGSGAGGGLAALKLANMGFQVTVLEKGMARDPEENPEDELAEINLERHRPSAELDPTLVYRNGELVSRNTRVGQSFYLVGGGTVRYTATSWRLRNDDFRKATKYGVPTDSSLVDWPITYEELEPFYTEAEYEIGISGKAGIDPTEPKRSKDVLLPPLKEDIFQVMLTKGAKKLGWNPFPIPVAIHSQSSDRTGAMECMQCGYCAGFPCRFDAKSSTSLVIYPRLAKNKKFKLVQDAYVSRVLLDSSKKKVKAVEYIDIKTKQTHIIECKILFLAASAIQTTRLLLNSSPEGLSNSSGQLGKNLMFHLEAKASALFETRFPQAYYKKVGIHDFYFPSKKDSFINHRSIQSGSKAPPIAFALGKSGFGKDYMEMIQKDFIRFQEIQAMVEDLPQEKNMVKLSKTKDPWGIYSPEIHHQYHQQDKVALESCFSKMHDLLEIAGGKKIELPKKLQDDITGRYTWHLMGTARMGNDPSKSVLNKFCQSHDHKNLFIVDGSSFCSSGGLNPTLTIQALALRAAQFAGEELKKGSIT